MILNYNCYQLSYNIFELNCETVNLVKITVDSILLYVYIYFHIYEYEFAKV